MSRPSGGDRVIVALDYPTLDEALALQSQLEGIVTRFKIGLELFTAAGPRAVEAVRERGGRVFLDLKIHDIPETARRAARAGAAMGAELITVHISGGPAMLEAAVEGARHGGGAAVLGVTVLTSLDALEMAHVETLSGSLHELVVKRAKVAETAGCAGVIASPREVAEVRAAVGGEFLVVTPGVRSRLSIGDDQKRVATAVDAIRGGASAVVVGRPIRDAPDPRAAAIALIDELDKSDKS